MHGEDGKGGINGGDDLCGVGWQFHACMREDEQFEIGIFLLF